MGLFAWKEDYAVSHVEIDSQHRQLFRLADDLHQAMLDGKARDQLAGVLARLVEYTKGHFATEERLMLANGYPEYPSHKAEHDSLTRKVVDFHQDLEAGRAAISVQLLQFLKDWLAHHIAATDRKVAGFLRAKRAVPRNV
jgi:hemerythrin